VLLFGLTGGIASGKSTVAARFKERGLSVIDADVLAREVVEPGSEGLAAVVAAFGDRVLDPRGALDGRGEGSAPRSLDRKRLGEIVFGDEARRRELNGILHPRIAMLTLTRRGELEARGVEHACYEAALLVENGLAGAFRPLVVVAVSEELQIARTVARDGATEAEARARIRAQLPLAEKVKLADYVIDNSGSIEATRAAADRVLDEVLNTRR
jgi:dephospho-CoA kinase